MNKVYNRIIWHNDTTPALNESNLNAMSKGIDDIDTRVVDLAGNILETIPQLEEDIAEAQGMIEDLEDLNEHPPIIGQNGNWWVWNPQTRVYVDTGVDASITVQIADITMLAPDATPYVTNTGTSTDPVFHLFIPRGTGISNIAKTGTSGLVDTYTITCSDGSTYNFTVNNGKGITSIARTSTSGLSETYTITYNDGTTSTFIVTNGKSAYQYAQEGGYSGTEADFYNDMASVSTYASDAQTYASQASASATQAGASATESAQNNLKSEGFAVGEQNGVPVGPGSPYYQNNASYYAQQAGQYASGGLIFKGSVAFAQIPTTGMVNGDMYNITDDFTTDSRFIEGAGVSVKAGADIAYIAGSVNKWDILALGGGGADALTDLSDVDITSPIDGQGLVYDGTAHAWVNGDGATNKMNTDGSNADNAVKFPAFLSVGNQEGNFSLTSAISKPAGANQLLTITLPTFNPIYDVLWHYRFYSLRNKTDAICILINDEYKYLNIQTVSSDTTTVTAYLVDDIEDAIELAQSQRSFFISNTERFTDGNGIIQGHGNIVSTRGASFGYGNVSYGECSHTEGQTTVATGSCSHAEGQLTQASNNYAHVEGGSNISSGTGSHAEGHYTKASSEGSHAEGKGFNIKTPNLASGIGSHVEGYAYQNGQIIASGRGSHAEGYIATTNQTITASGDGSHAEGGAGTTASGAYSHAEGSYAVASGNFSHVEGFHTTAGYQAQHVQGYYNSNKSNTLFEIGNGTSTTASNAFEVYTDGSFSQDNGTSKFKFIMSTAVSCAVGATSVTISNSAITTDSIIEPYCSNSSGTPITYASMVASAGAVIITFASALTEATSFKVRIS